MHAPRWTLILAITTVLTAVTVPGALGQSALDARVQRDLQQLVATPGGPPGAIVTLYRNVRTNVLTAGVSEVGPHRPPRATDYMRIGSIAKAFSEAIALELVAEHRLRLDDTIAERAPGLPRAWANVNVRELLEHTSGLPDYTESPGFSHQLEADPRGYVPPARIISWVARERVNFPPGARYRYSNTDNIVVGLIAERVTGRSYGSLLRSRVFGPLGLRHTSFPTGVQLPRPFLHGYVTAPGPSLTTSASR